MIGFLSRNFLFIILAGIVIAGGVWYTLRGGSASPTIITTQTEGGSAEKEVVDTLLALRAVTLSGTIFSDPAFQTLQDFGVQIVPETVGRENPFAPKEGAQTAATGTRATSPQ
ncbi:hypothetical protein C4585_01205 [Candidatus Parcubacteria bacterium]|nr:MAG: hypothetical protein C4585_01205 [Candidatus Parcubacteria bacterium]